MPGQADCKSVRMSDLDIYQDDVLDQEAPHHNLARLTSVSTSRCSYRVGDAYDFRQVRSIPVTTIWEIWNVMQVRLLSFWTTSAGLQPAGNVFCKSRDSWMIKCDCSRKLNAKACRYGIPEFDSSCIVQTFLEASENPKINPAKGQMIF